MQINRNDPSALASTYPGVIVILRIVAVSACTGILAAPAFAQEVEPSSAEVQIREPSHEGEEILVFGRLTPDRVQTVPQSVELISGDLIEASRSETVGDALRLIPGASRDGSVFDVFGDSYLIRGFPANQTVNGMTANALRQARDTVSIERIEVLKGPASVLYGQLQPGAVVNVVTRQPERTFSGEASLSLARYDDWRGTIDLTGPIAADGALRFRVTGAYDNAESVIDFWHRDHYVIAPTIAADLGSQTTLTIEALHMRNRLEGFLNGLPAEGTVLPNPNGLLPLSLGLTDPTFDPSIRINDEVSARLDHRFSDDLRMRAGLSWTREKTDEEGIFGLLGWDEQFRTLTRAVLTSSSRGEAWTAYGDVAATVHTGPLRHELVVGADHSWFDRDNVSEVGLAPSLDLYAPVYELNSKPGTFPLPDFGSTSSERNRSLGIFAQDRMVVSERLRFVGGVRWSRYRQRTDTVQGTGDTVDEQQSQTAWTSQLGVLFNPTPNISLFANRTTSFLPVSGITSEGLPLEPETGVQYEVGARASLAGNRITVSVALFHLKRGNVAVSDRDDPSALIAIGEQVSRGVELSVSARPLPGLQLYGGYAFTDAETTKDTNADLVGKPIRNVPRHSAVFRANYELQSGPVRGLSFGGIASYTGERSGDLEDTFELPAYWRLDLHANYPLNRNFSVGASVENVTDERYYTHAFSLFEVWPGAPLTWKVDLTARF